MTPQFVLFSARHHTISYWVSPHFYQMLWNQIANLTQSRIWVQYNTELYNQLWVRSRTSTSAIAICIAIFIGSFFHWIQGRCIGPARNTLSTIKLWKSPLSLRAHAHFPLLMGGKNAFVMLKIASYIIIQSIQYRWICRFYSLSSNFLSVFFKE